MGVFRGVQGRQFPLMGKQFSATYENQSDDIADDVVSRVQDLTRLLARQAARETLAGMNVGNHTHSNIPSS